MVTIAYPIIIVTSCLALIAVVLIGYPVLLWFCAPRAGDGTTASAPPTEWPSVDVITVVRNGERLIEQKINNTFDLD